jgi:hypothetical protein
MISFAEITTIMGSLHLFWKEICKNRRNLDPTLILVSTVPARASGALKAKKEDPLIDFGAKETKKKEEWSSWENDAWDALSK